MPGPDAFADPLGVAALAPEADGALDSEPSGAPDSWGASGDVTSPPYAPHLEAVRQARTFVRSQLEGVGLGACSDDAGLMVSELAANAVLHARTPFEIHLRPTLEGGARVEVHDQSPLPPVFTAPSATAMSGRGLNLVQTMAVRWGSHPLPGADGKMVWFEIEPTCAPAAPETSISELLALWNDADEPDEEAQPGEARDPDSPEPVGRVSAAHHSGVITSSLATLGPTREVVIVDLPVAELLAAKEAMDDLLREIQLLLLATPPSGTPSATAETADAADSGVPRTDRWLDLELVVAARLDAAAHGFEHGRRQIREQVSRAAANGHHHVTVHLVLAVGAGAAVARYREVLEDAERLSRSGHLLALPGDLDRHTRVRRHYLDEIIRQLAD